MTFDHSDLIVRKLIPSQKRALWEPDSPSDLMESGELQILRGWRGCQLDSQECLSLDQILHSFSAPISEEHAWAVIHQVSLSLSLLLILTVASISSAKSVFMIWDRATQRRAITRFRTFFYLSDWSLQFHYWVYWRCFSRSIGLNVKISIWINLVSMTENPLHSEILRGIN